MLRDEVFIQEAVVRADTMLASVRAYYFDEMGALWQTLGRRAVLGATERFQHDPYWRDLVPFHEYFHGDTGAGLGAAHQTGWTALVAKLIQQSGVPAVT